MSPALEGIAPVRSLKYDDLLPVVAVAIFPGEPTSDETRINCLALSTAAPDIILKTNNKEYHVHGHVLGERTGLLLSQQIVHLHEEWCATSGEMLVYFIYTGMVSLTAHPLFVMLAGPSKLPLARRTRPGLLPALRLALSTCQVLGSDGVVEQAFLKDMTDVNFDEFSVTPFRRLLPELYGTHRRSQPILNPFRSMLSFRAARILSKPSTKAEEKAAIKQVVMHSHPFAIDIINMLSELAADMTDIHENLTCSILGGGRAGDIERALARVLDS